VTTLKQQEQTESQIARNQRELLRAAGWMVRSFSQDIRTRRALAGFPDTVAFKHGVTLLVESKTRTGRLRDKQQQFYDDIAPHLGPCLWYVLARDVEALEVVLAEIVRSG